MHYQVFVFDLRVSYVVRGVESFNAIYETSLTFPHVSCGRVQEAIGRQIYIYETQRFLQIGRNFKWHYNKLISCENLGARFAQFSHALMHALRRHIANSFIYIKVYLYSNVIFEPEFIRSTSLREGDNERVFS